MHSITQITEHATSFPDFSNQNPESADTRSGGLPICPAPGPQLRYSSSFFRAAPKPASGARVVVPGLAGFCEASCRAVFRHNSCTTVKNPRYNKYSMRFTLYIQRSRALAIPRVPCAQLRIRREEGAKIVLN